MRHKSAAVCAVSDGRYSHVNHFARIYFEQIRLIEELVRKNPERRHVVAVSCCGRGHDILTIGSFLAKHGMAGNVRFHGIDKCDTELNTAHAMLRERPEIEANLVRWETPRLCRGGSKSLTDTGVHRGNFPS